MQIIHTEKNIFDFPISASEAVCVTTNGMIKRNGDAVMGAGIAKEANERFHLAGKLAEYLRKYGNRPFNMGIVKHEVTEVQFKIITFPTKHDWKNNSDLNLIRDSAINLIKICDKWHITKCYLPPVGCANGKLDWETQVYPVLAPLLDDRFVVVKRN